MYNVEVIFNEYVLTDTEVRTFPVSRHRSARIHKKLIKRYGSEFRRVPAIYHDTVRNIFYAHPSFKKELEAKLSAPVDCLSNPGMTKSYPFM